MSSRLRFTSLIVALVSFGLVLGQTPGALAESPTAVPAQAVSQPVVTDRPDAVSAMVAATAQKHRVEDTSQRTPTSATFANPNGTWTTEAYAGVVRSKGDQDNWVPIDTDVEKQGGAFEPTATPYDAQFSDGGDKTLGSVTSDVDATVKVGWPTKLPAPQAAGDQLTYSDAVPGGGDLVVTSHPDGFSYSIVLDHAPAADATPLEYRIPLTFDGVTATPKPDGSVVLKDGSDKVGVMTAPMMWDNSTDAGADQGNDSGTKPVSSRIEGDGPNQTLVLKPDMDFLRDPATTYPVTVDPQFSLSPSGDTYVESTSFSGSPNATELRVGTVTLGITQYKTFLGFDLSSLSSMSGSADSASLTLSNFGTGDCNGSAIRMSRVTAAFTISTMTWANAPATTSTGSTTNTTAYGASGCAGEGAATWDATQVVNDARAAGTTNLGLMLSADNNVATSGYRQYRSMENGTPSKVPTLVVTFNKTPNTPTATSVAPGNSGYATSLTPTLSAVVSDPDGGQVRGKFIVVNGAGTTVWSGTSGWATSGDRVSVTVPSGNLTDGTSYTAKAYSEDSLTDSTAPQSNSFTVDVTAPTATITSTGYTNNTWTTTVPTSNTFTYTGSSDTATFDTVTDGVPRTVYPYPSTSYITFPFAPIAYWNVLQVTPVDKAGNRGPTSTFSFGSGAPGFSSPYPNARSTSTFPLDISAPPNATGVSLGWKMHTESTWRTPTHVTKDGSAWSGTVSTSGGRSQTGQLVWNAAAETYGSGTLKAPAVVDIDACFHFASGGDKCTYPDTVQLVPSAFGDNFPTADLGPASVALFTGEASIAGEDASDSSAGIGRTFSSYDPSTVNAGVFGPGWSDPETLLAPDSDAKAVVIDDRSQDGSFVIVDPSGGTQVFVPASGSTTQFVPLQPTGDATAVTFTAGTSGASDSLVLSRPLGSGVVTTTWTLETSDTGGSPQWIVESDDAPGTSSDISVTNDHQRPTFVRESDPTVASTCNATTQTLGCRGLSVTYTGTGSAMRVASIARVVGAATQSAVTTTTIAAYNYTSGQLTSVCSAAPSTSQPALCTGYTYATVAGRTELATITPPGQTAWRFGYDSTGRLLTVKRAKPTGGDATWSVDYSQVPWTSGSTNGLPDLTAATAATWSQQTIPTNVYAVYQPINGTSDITKATLYYTTSSGEVTNTATYGTTGWLVDTNWYDSNGNVVRRLDGAGWRHSQDESSAVDKQRIAAQDSQYNVYNTSSDPTKDSTRVVDEYGPAHTATLRDGTVGLFRTHTHTMYDDSPDVDSALIADRPGSTGLGLQVEQTDGVTDVSMGAADKDVVVTKYGYGPIVTGDGNGWTLGRATKVTSQLGTGSTVAITRYDASGRVIESRQPGASEDGSHQGNDAHSSDTTYYTATGSGDCGGRPQWSGLVCKVGPAAQPAGTSVPVTFTSSYDDALQPVTVQEVSGGTTARTTTTTYDNVGRVTGVTKVTAGSGVANETISTAYAYDDTTGLATTTSNTVTGKTITTGYDTWGRVATYTDELGTSSATTYDDAGNIATFNDGSATYTYSYGAQNAISSVAAGGGVGTFSYAYTSAGDLDTVTYPNGMVAKSSYDQAGFQTGLAYTQGSTQVLGFTATVDAAGRTVAQSSQSSAQQFTFDDAGRLTATTDTSSTGCSTRTYGYDAAWNRSSFAAYAPGSTGQCQTTTSTVSRTSTHDAADRDSNSGYTYDTLGRALTVPQADTTSNAAGALTSTYHADDMIASLSQSVVNGTGTEVDANAYGLDPAERIDSIVNKTNGTETSRLRYRFAAAADAPAAIESSTNGGTSWTATRYVAVPGVGMAGAVTGGAATLELANLHGDVVASLADTSGSMAISSFAQNDEFGNTSAIGTPTRYGWLGSQARSRDAVGGLVLMGSRIYNPTTGEFLQSDPVLHGGLTTYGYPNDPVNLTDVNGQYWGEGFVKKVIKAAKFVVNWVLIDLVEGAVGRVVADAVFASACDGMVMICRAAAAGIIAFIGTLVISVAKGKSVKDSLGNAAWDGVFGFLREFDGDLSYKRLRTVGNVINRGSRAFSNFLRDYGHPKIANGVLTVSQMLVDDLYEVFTG